MYDVEIVLHQSKSSEESGHKILPCRGSIEPTEGSHSLNRESMCCNYGTEVTEVSSMDDNDNEYRGSTSLYTVTLSSSTPGVYQPAQIACE